MNYGASKYDFRIGDQVRVDSSRWPGVWTVIKINPKNLKLEQNGRRLNAAPAFLTKVGDAPLVANTSVYPPRYPGQVVKVRGRDGYWVVIKDSYDTVAVAKLGGDNGRYLKASPALLTTVTNFEIKEV